MTRKTKSTTRGGEKGLTADDLGAALHTALRKVCDSRPTSLLYNVVTLCKDPDPNRNGWSRYVRAAFPLLAKAVTTEAAVLALRRASAEANDTGPGSAEGSALWLTMELLDDDDWACMLAFADEFTSIGLGRR